jgi:hypothetical protein
VGHLCDLIEGSLLLSFDVDLEAGSVGFQAFVVSRPAEQEDSLVSFLLRHCNDFLKVVLDLEDISCLDLVVSADLALDEVALVHRIVVLEAV